MASTNILLLGCRGLGVEIGCATAAHANPLTPSDAAKNIVLAGVHSLTIHDPEPATAADLGSQARRTHTRSP